MKDVTGYYFREACWKRTSNKKYRSKFMTPLTCVCGNVNWPWRIRWQPDLSRSPLYADALIAIPSPWHLDNFNRLFADFHAEFIYGNLYFKVYNYNMAQ